MLQQLSIKNIAIIKNLVIKFNQGLNILTGETGAGKSIIIDCINIAMGNRVTKDVIRTGTDKATVEAVFHLDVNLLNNELSKFGLPLSEDGILILYREISNNGRNSCWINNRAVTMSTLRDIGNALIDIHGQHDNQSLFNVASHITLLDLFGGDEISKLKTEYTDKYHLYLKIKHDINTISSDASEIQRQKDFLEFQCSEIASAQLVKGEEEELIRRRNILLNSQKILNTLESSYTALKSDQGNYMSIIDSLSTINKKILDVSTIERRLTPIYETIETITYQLQDIATEIRSIKDTIDFEDYTIDQLNERLDVISKLKRKYGGSVEDILENLADMEDKLSYFTNQDEMLENLQKKKDTMTIELLNLCEELSLKRHNAAKILESNISETLEELEMKKTKFYIDIEFNSNLNSEGEYPFTENGLDNVEFMISTSPGQPLKPLYRIASGGEISRVMLAIKTILAKVDNIPTLIFDEIDMGISGKTAQQVGQKMSQLSRQHQLICVTHLAQIACMADSHYKVSKNINGDDTDISVEMLNYEAAQNEIARILSGSKITPLTLRHAAEIINSAKQMKKSI